MSTEKHPGLGDHSAIFEQTKCGDLIKGQTIITISSELAVEQAAEILVKNGISSAPVYDEKKAEFVGMFDYQDLVSYILIVFQRDAWKEEEADIEIQEIVKRALHYESVPVRFVSDLSHRDPFYTVPADAALAQAMSIFATGIHRVCVTNAQSGAVEGILSQSTVSNFVYSKLNQVPTALKSVQSLGVIHRDIHPINSEAQVFAAMKLMHDHGLSSVPMVDSSGHLNGSISLSDIKYVLRGFKYNMLWRTCYQFIAHVRNHQGLVEDKGRDRYPVFDIHPEDSLAKAIGKMGATKSHRVWVVDSAGRAIGVVSLTDALSALVSK